MNTRDSMHDPERPPLSDAARAVMSPRALKLLEYIEASTARVRERQAKEASLMPETTDDLQAALDARKSKSSAPGAPPWVAPDSTEGIIGRDAEPGVIDDPATATPKPRAPKAFAKVSIECETEADAKAFLDESQRFLATNGVDGFPGVCAMVRLVREKLSPSVKVEEEMHLNDRVYYMNSKARCGKLVDITELNEKEYGTVAWDVFTKTPLSVVPMDNLRLLERAVPTPTS